MLRPKPAKIASAVVASDKEAERMARIVELSLRLVDLESGCNITQVKKKGCSKKDLFAQ